MKILIIILSSSLAIWGILNLNEQKSDTIFQVSTIQHLQEGQFDGTVPYGRLKTFGNFGVGTFNHLDGEMVALDGQFYQVKADGRAYPVESKVKTPFAEVTNFEADLEQRLDENFNLEELLNYLQNQVLAQEGYQAIKISGKFKSIKTRSVPPQDTPNTTLADAISKQVVFDYQEVEGTMVGFYMPKTAQDIGIPGFHFHFLSKDKTFGGHLLDCSTEKVMISVDHCDELEVLPSTISQICIKDQKKKSKKGA